jgi:hypothetical protein
MAFAGDFSKLNVARHFLGSFDLRIISQGHYMLGFLTETL